MTKSYTTLSLLLVLVLPLLLLLLASPYVCSLTSLARYFSREVVL